MNYKQYREYSKELYERKPNPKNPKGQKFPIGTRVRISNPSSLIDKENGPNEIYTVDYTYSQKYWGDDVKSYSLTDSKGCSSSWYNESELSLVE